MDDNENNLGNSSYNNYTNNNVSDYGGYVPNQYIEPQEANYSNVQTENVKPQKSSEVKVYKDSSDTKKIIGISLVVAIIVSVISSSLTYFLVSNGGITKTLSDITYNVEGVENPVVAVSKIAGNSVVGVKVDYYEQSFFGQLEEGESEGSGIIYSEDGYIITNNHVIEEAVDSNSATVTITLNDGTEYEAEIIGRDETTDLALLKIDAKGLNAAKFGNSDDLQVGELAVAIGNPLGSEFAGSVTAGYISALDRTLTIDSTTYKLIQTDAAINPGNSGGALVNSKGEIIGINSAKISSTGVEGLGFAIPINEALEIIEQLKVTGKIIRPYIGIYGLDLDETTARRNKLVEGVYVYQVYTNTPAQKAGISRGDIIVGIDGKDVTTKQELNEIKNSKNIGDTVELKLYRNGKYETIKVTLDSDENVSSTATN